MGEVELPAGLQARAPLSVSLERPFGTFRSTYSVEGGSSKVERRLSLKQDTLAAADLAGYEAFRKAVETDRDQEFALQGLAAGAVGAESLRAEGHGGLPGEGLREGGGAAAEGDGGRPQDKGRIPGPGPGVLRAAP